jgi:hypothetical protein
MDKKDRNAITKLTKLFLNLNMTVFWDVAPCSLVEVYRRFRVVYYLHHQGDHLATLASVKKSPLFMKPEFLLPCSQEPTMKQI